MPSDEDLYDLYSDGMPRVTAASQGADDTFATWLRAARLEAGWTKMEAIKALEAARSNELIRATERTYFRWESGEITNPAPAEVVAVCRVLGLDVREALIALGVVTREELNAPSPTRIHPLAVEVNRRLLSPSLSDAEAATLRRAVERAFASWDDAMKLKAPKEPSAAERQRGAQIATELDAR